MSVAKTTIERVAGDADLSKSHPSLVSFVEFLRANVNFPVRVVSATRGYDEQDKIYAWGRTVQNPYAPATPDKPFGPVATNARGGESAHQPRADGYSHAIDLAPIPATESNYRVIGNLAKSRGLSWGGDWTTLKDMPHVETPNWRKIPVVQRA